jgi:hypothetical protein
VIFLVVLTRVLSDSYTYSPAIIYNLWMGILFLAPIAFLLSVIIFLILGVSRKIKMADQILDFLFPWSDGLSAASELPP